MLPHPWKSLPHRVSPKHRRQSANILESEGFPRDHSAEGSREHDDSSTQLDRELMQISRRNPGDWRKAAIDIGPAL